MCRIDSLNEQNFKCFKLWSPIRDQDPDPESGESSTYSVQICLCQFDFMFYFLWLVGSEGEESWTTNQGLYLSISIMSIPCLSPHTPQGLAPNTRYVCVCMCVCRAADPPDNVKLWPWTHHAVSRFITLSLPVCDSLANGSAALIAVGNTSRSEFIKHLKRYSGTSGQVRAAGSQRWPWRQEHETDVWNIP